jgi:hypothetical protein
VPGRAAFANWSADRDVTGAASSRRASVLRPSALIAGLRRVVVPDQSEGLSGRPRRPGWDSGRRRRANVTVRAR